ncbi:hypothetical protein [Pedobacter frigiditerrae]|nr:hypothetical protein [Pedobacter frigiditerrae]
MITKTIPATVEMTAPKVNVIPSTKPNKHSALYTGKKRASRIIRLNR